MLVEDILFIKLSSFSLVLVLSFSDNFSFCFNNDVSSCNNSVPIWDVAPLNWIGLDWIGLDWIGLDWIGLD